MNTYHGLQIYYKSNITNRQTLSRRMPKILVVIMDQQYPFNSNQHPNTSNQQASVVVRQKIPISIADKTQKLAKATFAKNLKNKNLVKISSILQEQNLLHIQYQFIETKNQWMKFNNIFVQIYEQLRSLTNYLINIGVKTPITINKIGVTEHNYVKFFMGLDFVWDSTDDDTELLNYYQNQLTAIFGDKICRRQTSMTQELVPYSSWPESEIDQQFRDRKGSFATLPSHYSRFLKIGQQLTEMKSNVKQITSKPNHLKNLMRSQSNQQLFVRNLAKPTGNVMNKPNKKYQDRKYSGDSKFTMFASKKLFEKESDIKSERGFQFTVNKFQQRRYQQNNQEEIQTVTSKSRIEQMKYQQYMQITKSNKKYLQDFISVLEDQSDCANGNPTPCKSIEYATEDKSYDRLALNRSNNQRTQHTDKIVVHRTAQQLQKKAKQAINNSLIAIKRFKNISV